jgi:CelD/BcsL family acetyltransferase involved in cellulose biosynthesis
MDAALAGLATAGNVSIHRLFVDARAVAAIVMLRSGSTAWSWKTAYDESFASASPGVQLMLDVTESLLADPEIARVDSCATAHHPMIDHIWRERLAVADVVARIGPDGRAGFTLACTLEAARRGAVAAAKRLRDSIKQR